MKNFLQILFRVLFSTAIAGIFAVLVIVLYTNAQLPPVNVLEDIQLQVPLKIYSADGKLIAEFGEKRRTPISIKEVPETLIMAILATEDRRFYEHNGVDLRGMARAGLHLLVSGTKGQGASTITMQVARNFFLTRKKTFGRKLNEVLLAVKIENELPKDKILELYLNKIYFGKRAYGVQAAAQVYYGTTVDKLSLAQMAMIAGLPQAPSAINPINNPEGAQRRRAHVLKRMLHYGFINEKQYEKASKAPILTDYHGRFVEMSAPYVAEMARKEVVDKFGPDVYTNGLVVYTTVDSKLQNMANRAIHQGLTAYDKRHGFRGPIAKLPSTKKKNNTQAWTQKLATFASTETTLPCAITQSGSQPQGLLANGKTISLNPDSVTWARHGLKVGDVVMVEQQNKKWNLSQIPDAEAALVAIHPKNGAILALVGGYDFGLSPFNRATQSNRQPGSNFKPFVYAAALERGFTPASIINDAPIVFHDNSAHLEEAWRPQNDTRQFYGPTRLRVGLTKSRNLVSIRILQAVGISETIRIIQRFGFSKQNLPAGLSLALGTGIASPMEMAAGYAAFANGGYKIEPHIISKVVDSQNKVIYSSANSVVCPDCQKLTEENIDPDQTAEDENAIDKMAENKNTNSPGAKRIIDPQTAYIMTSILQDVIKTGTAFQAKELQRDDIAGKTGTTQNQMDAWFTGFNQSLVASVWVGFDSPKSLKEYGSQAALPIWMDFMRTALQGVPQTKPEQPRGIVSVKIDPDTGLLAQPGQPNAIFEIFRQDNMPSEIAQTEQSAPNVLAPNQSGESLF